MRAVVFGGRVFVRFSGERVDSSVVVVRSCGVRSWSGVAEASRAWDR